MIQTVGSSEVVLQLVLAATVDGVGPKWYDLWKAIKQFMVDYPNESDGIFARYRLANYVADAGDRTNLEFLSDLHDLIVDGYLTLVDEPLTGDGKCLELTSLGRFLASARDVPANLQPLVQMLRPTA